MFGFQQTDRLNSRERPKGTFFRAAVLNTQGIIVLEKYQHVVVHFDLMNDKYCQSYEEKESCSKYLTKNNSF